MLPPFFKKKNERRSVRPAKHHFSHNPQAVSNQNSLIGPPTSRKSRVFLDNFRINNTTKNTSRITKKAITFGQHKMTRRTRKNPINRYNTDKQAGEHLPHTTGFYHTPREPKHHLYYTKQQHGNKRSIRTHTQRSNKNDLQPLRQLPRGTRKRIRRLD